MALAALGAAHAQGGAALPVLHVGAADVAAENTHQHSAGFRLREGVLHKFHFAVFQIRDFSVHSGAPPYLRCMSAL